MAIILDDAKQRIIDAVVDAPTAWRTPEELAKALGWTLDQTLDEVAELDSAGWLDAWERADGPAVTLSVAASARLGVRLVEVGADETPRWARAGELDPAARRAAGVFHSARMAGLDLVADDRPGAEQALIHREEAEQVALAPRGEHRSAQGDPAYPRPILLIGTGLSPWPGPAQATGSECPACRAIPIPEHAYCIRCDRSGRDATGPVASTRGRKAAASAFAARAVGQADKAQRHESERKRRQDKRKRRRAHQVKPARSASRPIVPLWMAPVAG